MGCICNHQGICGSVDCDVRSPLNLYSYAGQTYSGCCNHPVKGHRADGCLAAVGLARCRCTQLPTEKEPTQ
jgi:hypothetical protein